MMNAKCEMRAGEKTARDHVIVIGCWIIDGRMSAKFSYPQNNER